MRFRLFAVAVVVTGTVVASAQVASHAPTTVAKKAPSTAAVQAAPAEFKVKPVARVNGVTLNDIDLVREMFSMFPYARQHNGFPKSLEPEIRKGALEMIIYDELLYQEAKRRNLNVPPAQLNRAEKEFRKQFANKAEYQQFLKVEVGGSPAAMREKIRRSLLIEKMSTIEVSSKAAPTLAEIKAYYNKNAKQFEHGELIHIQSISIIPPKGASAEVLKEAKRRAEEALKSANAAKDYREFGLLAEKLSDDDYHVNMGDHRERGIGDLPPEIVKAARGMKPGHVSNLIQLGGNYTIFRLVAHTPAGKTSFEKAKAKISADLQKQKTEQLRSALNKKLQKNAKIERL